MSRLWTLFASALFLASFGVGAGAAQAGRACVAEVNCERRECNASCREERQAAADLCLRRDHECVEVCRAERESCVDDTGLASALQLCRDETEADRQVCRTLTAPDTPERDLCIDEVQVAGFQCRDDAREAGRPLLRLCRRAFGTCARACARSDRSDPAIDIIQCRADAAAAAAACKAACTEDAQLGKDACRNRDHECAEDCRAGRTACKGPVLDALEAAWSACRATRDQAIANCRALHAPDSLELDACIDAAQVEAFRCRDAARETARPQLAACRAGHRSCVLSCPAPAP